MTRDSTDRGGEEGYLLIGLVVVCFLLLLALSVAAPRMAKELERDREVESEHRGLEYVRAIQLYYRKNNAYPTSIEQLMGSGTTGVAGPGQVKYLRQKYNDPLTRGEFRLIHVNEAQTEVKGFFGEPLPGIPVGLGAGLPGTSSAAAAIGGSTPGMAVNAGAGGSSGAGGGFSLGTSSFGAQSGGAGSTMGTASGTGAASGSAATPAAGGSSTASSSSSTDATTFAGSKGGFIGVGSNGSGKGLVEWNGSEDIAQWEFLYDPRVEQMKAKVSILGGTAAANGTGALGSGFAPLGGAGGISGTSTPGTSLAPPMGTNGAGTAPSAGTTATPAQ